MRPDPATRRARLGATRDAPRPRRRDREPRGAGPAVGRVLPRPHDLRLPPAVAAGRRVGVRRLAPRLPHVADRPRHPGVALPRPRDRAPRDLPHAGAGQPHPPAGAGRRAPPVGRGRALPDRPEPVDGRDGRGAVEGRPVRHQRAVAVRRDARPRGRPPALPGPVDPPGPLRGGRGAGARVPAQRHLGGRLRARGDPRHAAAPLATPPRHRGLRARRQPPREGGPVPVPRRPRGARPVLVHDPRARHGGLRDPALGRHVARRAGVPHRGSTRTTSGSRPTRAGRRRGSS